MSDYLFTISVLDDDSYIVTSYDNAFDAITEYNKYIDHGNAHIRRVVLNEPMATSTVRYLRRLEPKNCRKMIMSDNQPIGEIMDNMINRCAHGAWHYGEKLCEVCRKARKE